MNWTVLVYDNRDDLVPPEDHLIVGAGSNGEVQAGRITSDGNLDLLELTQQQKDDIAAIWRDGIEDVIPLNVPDFHSKVLYGPKADIPVAGQPGGEERFYIATDEGAWYRDVGYQWKDSDAADGPTYTWEDISATGTEVTLADDAYETVDIGFTFLFMQGHKATEAHIGDNGTVGLGASDGVADEATTSIPSSGGPNNVVCPFWTDLDPTATGATVHYESLGTAPDRRFIVQYTDFQVKGTSDNLTFQAILYENGEIKFQYKDMPGDGDGSSATIGIEDKDGETGIQVSHGTVYVKNEMAVLIQPRWELMFGADALAEDSSQRTLRAEGQKAAAGDHNHELPPLLANLEAVAGDELAILTWDNPQNPSITYYEYLHPGVGWTTIPGSGPDTTTYTVRGLTYGTQYNLSLRAVNSYAEGDGAGPISQVYVPVGNIAPTADAGADQTVDAGETVTLMGTGDDEFPDSLTYEWRQHLYGRTPAVTLSDTSVANPTFTAPGDVRQDYPLSFYLTVTDRRGASHVDGCWVFVRNRRPTANAGEDQTVGTGDTVTLTGSATDPDPGDTLTYIWVQTSGTTVTLSDATVVNPTFTAPDSAAILEFILIVLDSSKDVGVDRVTITVQAADQAGTVVFSAETPLVDTALTATLTDPDGSITDLTWQWARSPDYDASTETGTWTDITGATSGSYTPSTGDVTCFLRATASYTDGHGSGKTAEAISANAVTN